ncbi:MAG: hypothetical protein HQK68_02275 [Desulfamplus sp.]|nr:hypothetical protein [Desulfamplus sp.]
MRLKVTEHGIVIPKSFFKGIEEVEVKKERNFIAILPKAKEDSIFKIGLNPVECGYPDASENLDMYIYGTSK